MTTILLHKNTQAFEVEISLVSSKSESNRALIINALTGFGSELSNLSAARDTQTMMRLLQSPESVADVLDAGTTMRFLTAYFAATNQPKTMTGTPRMCERPIGLLVDALCSLGAEVEYQGKEGYPPMLLKGFKYSGNKHLTIRGDVSSQYISALAMIAPTLPEGLSIQLTGEVGSVPYIEMTLEQMRFFGASVQSDWDTNTIHISPSVYEPKPYRIESDWSGASYWYSMVALGPEGSSCELLGLKEASLQGDSVITEMMQHLGVRSEFTGRGFKLSKIPAKTEFSWDFTNCPDLAQTIAVICVAKGIPAVFTGIESLKIKETDRVYALQTELAKIGGRITETNTGRYEVMNDGLNTIDSSPVIPHSSLITKIHTYDDHRMAMAFAPLANLINLVIEEPDVVKKSYPSFWEDMKKVFTIE